MDKKLRTFSRLALFAGSLLTVSGCAVYDARDGYANGDSTGDYAPDAESVYRSVGSRPYYDRGYHERRDWGDRYGRR